MPLKRTRISLLPRMKRISVKSPLPVKTRSGGGVDEAGDGEEAGDGADAGVGATVGVDRGEAGAMVVGGSSDHLDLILHYNTLNSTTTSFESCYMNDSVVSQARRTSDYSVQSVQLKCSRSL